MQIIQYFLGRWVLGIEKSAKLQKLCRKQMLTLFTSDAICHWGIFVRSIHLMTFCVFQCG